MLTLLVRLVMGFSNRVSSSHQMLQGCPEDSVRCFSGNYKFAPQSPGQNTRCGGVCFKTYCWKWRQEDSWCWLDSQHSLTSELQAREGTVSKRGG